MVVGVAMTAIDAAAAFESAGNAAKDFRNGRAFVGSGETFSLFVSGWACSLRQSPSLPGVMRTLFKKTNAVYLTLSPAQASTELPMPKRSATPISVPSANPHFCKKSRSYAPPAM
jgi:hypothetical protein